MSEDKIREWVEERLEDGIEPERIKKNLEKTGHDPSIVEDVRSPFADSEEEPDVDEEDFSFAVDEEEKEKVRELSQDTSGKTFSLPSLPSAPDIPFRYIGVVLLLAVLLGGGYVVTDGSPLSAGSGLIATVQEAASSGSGCPDIGVRIKSISTSSGSTTADVLVTNGPGRVVLEVYSDGVMTGSSQRRVGGEASMTVNAVGDRAVFYPAECSQFQDEQAIG